MNPRLKHRIRKAINRLGLDIRRVSPTSPLQAETDADAMDLIAIIRDKTMVAPEGLISLYHQARHCEAQNVPGAYVECGVWKGGASGLMALVNLKHGTGRRPIHLFDSFEEICEPDERVDGERAIREVRQKTPDAGTGGRLVPLKGIYDSSGGPGTVKGNRDLFIKKIGYDPGHLHIHQGWFQNTLPGQHKKIGPIAILRLDADWYASTKICLDYLYGHVISGGFIIFDDYGAYDGCRKAVDEFFAGRNEAPYLHYVNAEIRYVVKP
jgi:O-methyltransferase